MKKFLIQIWFLSIFALDSFPMDHAPKHISKDPYPTFVVKKKGEQLSIAKIKLIEHKSTTQLHYEFGIDVNTRDIAAIKEAFHDVIGKRLNDNDSFYNGENKYLNDVWNISENSPKELKYRLRMEHDKLILTAKELWRPLEISGKLYYPGFRTSFVVSKGQAKMNTHGKIANLLIFYSPNKVNGQGASLNLRDNLLIINLHLNYKNTASQSLKDSIAKYIDTLHDYTCKKQIQSIFEYKEWKKLKPIRKSDTHDSTAYQWYCADENVLPKFGFEMGYMFYFDKFTNDKLFRW